MQRRAAAKRPARPAPPEPSGTALPHASPRSGRTAPISFPFVPHRARVERSHRPPSRHRFLGQARPPTPREDGSRPAAGCGPALPAARPPRRGREGAPPPLPPHGPSPTWPRPAARGRSAHRSPPPRLARALRLPCPPSPHPPQWPRCPSCPRAARSAPPLCGGAGGAREEERAGPSPQKEGGRAPPPRDRVGGKGRGTKRGAAASSPEGRRPRERLRDGIAAALDAEAPSAPSYPPAAPPADEGGGGAASPLAAPGSYHGVSGAVVASLECWARRGLRQQEGKRRGREPSGNAADVTAAVPGGGSGCYGGTLRGNAPARSPIRPRACVRPQTPPTHRPHRGGALPSLACPKGGWAVQS